MKRVLILAAVLLGWPSYSFGNQSGALDSLLQKLSDLVFDYEPEAKRIIDSLNTLPESKRNMAYQHTLGNYHYLAGNYDSAYVVYSRALELALQEGDSSRILSLNNNIGVSLIELGRISTAVSYLTETLERRKHLQDTLRILTSYGNLIEAYQVLTTDDRVIQLLREAFSYQADSMTYASGLRRLHLLAYFHAYRLQDDKEALRHLRAMGRLNKLIGDARIEGEYFLGLGRIKARQSLREEAMSYFEKAIEVFQKEQYNGGITAAYREMAENTPIEATNKKLLYYQKALETVAAPDIEMSIYEGLFEIHRSLNRYDLALEALQRINLLRDSLQGLEVQKAVFEIESKYQLKEKENQIKQLRNQATIAQLQAENAEEAAARLNLYLWAGLSVGMLLIIIWIIQFRNNRLRQMQERLQANIQKQKAALEKQSLQMQLFRSQINPHFFFNTLNSIQSFVLDHQPLDSSRYLGRFAKLMRASLELNEEEFVSLNREFEVLNDYLRLEKLRFEDKFDFELNIADEIGDAWIPTMILQPFAENAIVHGFRDQDSGGYLEVKAKEGPEQSIEIYILDNGKGYEPLENDGQMSKHRSMALSLIKKRLHLLQEERGATFNYRIQNRQDQSGTEVRLRISRISKNVANNNN